MTDARPWFAGLPIEPDVKRFFDKYGTPDRGTMISHAEIAECIGARHGTPRYRTIYQAIKRRLERSHNLLTETERGVGLKVLTGEASLTSVKGEQIGVVRSQRRVAIRATLIPDDGFDEMKKKELGHLQQYSARMFMSMSNEVKPLRPPKAPPALPRAQAE